VCTPVPPRFMVIADPGVAFEVLSDSTANDDLVRNYGFSAPCALGRNASEPLGLLWKLGWLCWFC